MRKAWTRWLGATCFLIGSFATLAHADEIEKIPHRIPLRMPYSFTPPAGFTAAEPVEGAADRSVFDASSASPLATMHASYVAGARATDQALVDGKATELVAAYPAAHPGMAAKVVKKELVTISGTPVAHLVIEGATAGKAKKKAPAQREAHYFFGNTTHNAEVIYSTDAVSFTKLEPTFAASLRQPRGPPPPAPTPAPAPAPAH